MSDAVGGQEAVSAECIDDELRRRRQRGESEEEHAWVRALFFEPEQAKD